MLRMLECRRLLIVLFACSLAALPARGLHAQGTSGTMPDPITGKELNGYALRLDLSDKQRLAIDAFHERYLTEFQKLRETDIDAYLDQAGNLLRSFMFNPDADAAKKNLAELERIMGRIRAVDDRLFDQIGTVLSEEQLPNLPRVRDARARTRHGSGIVRFTMSGNPGARVDLSAIALAIDLAPSDHTAIDPLLRDYERQLTTRMRGLDETAREQLADVTKKMAVMMQEAQNQPGGRQRGGFAGFGGMRDIWEEAGRKIAEEASEISGLNRRTFRSTRAILSDDAGHRFRAGYWLEAYPDVYEGATRTVDQYDIAIDLPGVTGELEERIVTARGDLELRHDALADRIIDVIETQRRNAVLFRFGRGGDDPEKEKLERLQKERDEVNRLALDALNAMLSEGQIADLKERAAGLDEKETESFTVSVTQRGGGPGSFRATLRSSDLAVDAGGSDPFIPRPISARDLRRMAQRLGLDEDNSALLETLHMDYLDAYEELKTTHIQPIQDAQQKTWAIDGDSGEISGPSADDIDRLYALRAAAFDAIRALDGQFFDDVAVTMIADDDAGRAAMDRVRRGRDRVVYRVTDGGVGGLFGGGSRWMARAALGMGAAQENRIDLVVLVENLVDESGLDEEVMRRTDDVLAPYERDLVAILKQRHDTAFTYRREMEKISSSFTGRRPGEGGGDGRRGRTWGGGRDANPLMRETREQLETIEKGISDLNRSTLATLLTRMDGRGDMLDQAYRRAAHPDVYDDPGAAEPALRRALSLADLSETQRSQVVELLGEHVGPYRKLCDEMVAIRTDGDDADGDAGRDWQRWAEQRNEIERVRFAREEMNDKTLRRLRGILSEPQRMELGLVGDDDA